ncbi:MAG: DUF5688 family protein [Lachnospiraceae bacterium]|nr:DUF5688 family protein [Lachnospiraceae bacterium]
MDKIKFAMEIAKKVNGEVKEVEKNNGIKLIGISIKNDSNIYPTIYIDQMYEDDMSIDEAAKAVLKTYEEKKTPDFGDLIWIEDFNEAKKHLRARLYNDTTYAEVYKHAPYPFDDLIIIPYIEIISGEACTKVTKNLLKHWNVSAEEVIKIAEANSSEEVEILTMRSALMQMGISGDLLPEEDEIQLWIATTKDHQNGAYAIIAKLESLRKDLNEGEVIYVLPSSIHEVLFTKVGDKEEMDKMVKDVNETCLNPLDVLSDHAYKILP